MADDTQLEIISKDGVHRWNSWRAENPEVLTDLSEGDISEVFLDGANFENTNLQSANLHGSSLQKANLQGANLNDANLQGANLDGANLRGANLQEAKLENAKFPNTKLQSANFRGAVYNGAVFGNAEFSEDTMGLGQLTPEQGAKMSLVEVTSFPEDMTQEPDTEISDEANDLTVGDAKSIVGPAHLALQDLSIPNDISEEHRDLFVKLLSTVAELEQNLADIEEENRLFSEENEELRNSIGQALPLWKRAWEEFVLKGAGAAGASAGVFFAGFVAGMLYTSFSAADPGISV